MTGPVTGSGKRQSAGEIADEAAAWVARLDAEGWSAADEVLLEQWMAAHSG